jgi:hypothetical protein
MERRGFTSTEKSIRYSALESQLMRTFSPKYVSNFGDGSGRDTYAVVNNGGLAGIDKQHMMSKPFRNTFQNRIHNQNLKDAVSLTYHSDGTGRDSYVISNSGGLVNDYGGSHREDVRFKAHLRHNPA